MDVCYLFISSSYTNKVLPLVVQSPSPLHIRWIKCVEDMTLRQAWPIKFVIANRAVRAELNGECATQEQVQQVRALEGQRRRREEDGRRMGGHVCTLMVLQSLLIQLHFFIYGAPQRQQIHSLSCSQHSQSLQTSAALMVRRRNLNLMQKR